MARSQIGLLGFVSCTEKICRKCAEQRAALVSDRVLAGNDRAGQRSQMSRQTRELVLLSIIAAFSGMLAWALDDPLFVAVFTAETVWALFMAVYLSLPPD
jgi:hypothetical protein